MTLESVALGLFITSGVATQQVFFFSPGSSFLRELDLGYLNLEPH